MENTYRVTITEDRTGRTIQDFTRRSRDAALMAAYELINRHHNVADWMQITRKLETTGTADAVYRYEPITYTITAKA